MAPKVTNVFSLFCFCTYIHVYWYEPHVLVKAGENQENE